jgi:hypothetical protein
MNPRTRSRRQVGGQSARDAMWHKQKGSANFADAHGEVINFKFSTDALNVLTWM